MFGFLSRLFGRGTAIIKDPYLGKLRYLESENGKVWAGNMNESEQCDRVEFFIESDEKILRHESRNSLLDILEEFNNIKGQVNQKIIEEHPLQANGQLIIEFLHIPSPNANYDGEFICTIDDFSFSAIIHEKKIVEIVSHDK